VLANLDADRELGILSETIIPSRAGFKIMDSIIKNVSKAAQSTVTTSHLKGVDNIILVPDVIRTNSTDQYHGRHNQECFGDYIIDGRIRSTVNGKELTTSSSSYSIDNKGTSSNGTPRRFEIYL
jgi:hypothetical protein